MAKAKRKKPVATLVLGIIGLAIGAEMLFIYAFLGILIFVFALSFAAV